MDRIERAYSLLTVKSFDDDQRVITGIATTPEPDRTGDVVEPKGARFKLPLPLLSKHDSSKPIGHVTKAKVTSAGIEITARLVKPDADAPKTWADRLNEAWADIKSGLMGGLSIGFRDIESLPIKGTMGLRFLQWEWLELSAVVIPMHQEASILTIKALDSPAPAASGTRRATRPSTPGASGSSKATSMNVSEQITEKRTLLQTKSTRLEELMADQETHGGLQPDEQKELDTVTAEVDAITKSVANLETLERAQMLNLKRVEAPAHTLPNQSTSRTSITVKELPKGTLFTRYAMAKAAGRGSLSDTIEYAKRFSNTPELVQFIKAEAGTAVVGSPAWGGELVNIGTQEFVELLRPQTIIGRIEGFRRVPFNTRIVTQTGGSTFQWVGEVAPKPVGELAFENTTMAWSKVAGIIVLSEELIRLSSPSAEATVRQDMIEQCAKFLDEQFIQVAISAGANNPASITNGVASPSATGTTAAALLHDLNIALANFDTAGVSTENLVIVTTPALARGISLLLNTFGQPQFPGMTPTGGTILGYKVVVSASVDAGTVVIFKPSEIFLADDGRVTIDASREATLDMAGSTNATFSLWQNNCVALRAEQFIRWQKRRASGTVAIIDTAAYAPA